MRLIASSSAFPDRRVAVTTFDIDRERNFDGFGYPSGPHAGSYRAAGFRRRQVDKGISA